jgi:EAL domain-containing protein (putative c-di-GMP-specific phosphodiesterase class I)
VNVHPQELNEGWLIRPDDPIFLHDDDVYLEITESVPLTHFDLCLNVLREIRSRGGVHFVIDDLGAGYSNLKSIADLEPRVVKLDAG